MLRMMGSLWIALCIASSAAAAGTATLVGVGDLEGGAYESLVNGVSDDGGVVFGNSNIAAPKSQAFRWTEEFGIEGLGVDPEGTSAVAASSYGQYMVVTSLTDLWEWFFWTAPLGLERVTHGEVKGISADASVVASNDTRGALRWTAATGSVVLTPLGSDTVTKAMGISADGAYIVGVSHDEAGLEHHAVRWNADGVPEALGDLPGGNVYGMANVASADGSVVVGSSKGSGGDEAFRWTAETGMQGLGVLPGGFPQTSSAVAISPDGVVVLGQSSSNDGLVPFVWDAQHGIRRLSSALATDYGLDLSTTNWWLWDVKGISADRRTLVGTGLHNLAEPPGYQPAYEGYVVRLSTPLPEPNGLALGVIAVVVLATIAALQRRSRRVALLVTFFAATLGAGAARAQVEGTDCGCALTGAYLEPDAGVRPNASAVSPGGSFRVEGGALPGPISVFRQADNVVVLQVQAGDWGWSPDGDRILISQVSGTLPNQLEQYWLYDLSGGATSTPIWSTASTLWGSTRLRFSEDGAVFLFAGLAFNSQVQLQSLEVASGALLTTSFTFFSPPGNLDDDSNPAVAGWGFGPDPTRIAYGYTTGQDGFTRVLANVHTDVKRGFHYTAVAERAYFSPCGDAFAEKVQQLAGSGEVTVTLYSTANPQAAQIGNEGFPNGLAVEVRANADDHVGLLGGTAYPIATNVADDSCTPANDAPAASFAPPTSPVAGASLTFTDASTDADGTIVAWHWDFGDGATSSARNPSHTYDEPGTYTVRLTVTDDDGATGVAELEVRVCGDFANAAGRILFSTDAGVQGDGFNRDLFEFDAATRVTAQITDSDWCRTSGTCFAQFGGSGTMSGARLSPDGSQIAFTPGTYGENGIWVMDADGSNRRRLTDGSGSAGDFEFHLDPVWSPDGAWIAFVNRDVTLPADQTGLYMIRADGSGLVHVPGTTFRNPIADKSPDFFPEIHPTCAVLPIDQRAPGCYRIAYIRDPFTLGAGTTIRSVRGDGSEPSLLVPQADFYTQVRVSPDGSRLALQRERRIGVVYEEILVVDLANPGMPPAPVTFSDQWADSPVWSPDGALLAYRGLAVGTTEYDLYVTDTVGCTASALRAVPGVAELPHDWKPGSVSQGPVSLSGRAYTGGLITNGQGGIVVALSGDAAATATTAADGSFFFGSLPAGGSFLLSIVSAPGFVFDPTPIPIELGGHAVGALVSVQLDQAIVNGTVRLDGAPLEGMVIRAEGPGGPFEATTDTDGRYSLTTRLDQTYTISGRKPGYRLDPATRSVWVGSGTTLDLTAIAVAELPPGRLAFTRSSEGDDEIYGLDLATLTPVNLTNDPASDRDPAWSPDGTRIAFTSMRNGFDEIFLMDADGANPSGLGLSGFDPAWSPDGAWLVFATNSGLELYDVTTGATWSATFDPGDRSPRWLLDGSRRIAFERSVERQDGEFDMDLYTVDVSDLVNPSESVLVERPGDDLDPAFGDSLTGARFAYATADGDPANEIGISAEFAGSTDRTIPGRNPTWSADGRYVAYDDDAGSLWLFEPGSGNPPISLTDAGTTGFSDRDPDWQPSTGAACANGLDDDGDGLVDLDDPGCPVPYATLENPPCDNGLDDDGDGLTDFDDPKCTAAWPYWEAPPACGLGGELLFLYAAARNLLRRKRGEKGDGPPL